MPQQQQQRQQQEQQQEQEQQLEPVVEPEQEKQIVTVGQEENGKKKSKRRKLKRIYIPLSPTVVQYLQLTTVSTPKNDTSEEIDIDESVVAAKQRRLQTFQESTTGVLCVSASIC